MRKWLRAIPVAALVFSLVFAAAQATLAAPQRKTTKAEKKTLYDRLGKKDGITSVVNDFVSNVGADQRINKFFAKTDLDKLKLRSEEHTSELQSLRHLVCRLLLEKKKNNE